MISLSTHVLDTAEGRPAAGVRVELWRDDLLASAETDEDGRVRDLAHGLAPGTYRLVFFPRSPFFVRVGLELALDDGHYHVPLLTSPFACATYRGS